MPSTVVLQVTERGIYCPSGGFHVDPWKPVEVAVITHAHSDHATWGSRHFICSTSCAPILRERLGPEVSIQPLAFGEQLVRNGVKISLHPAGHILGSAQVRVEHHGAVWVVGGDYKTAPDPTCEAFEPVRCHGFVSESTFGLPIYRWPAAGQVFEEINAWWRENQERGRTSVLFGYAMGKAQRLLAGIDPAIGAVFAHGALLRYLPMYRHAGVRLPEVRHAESREVRLARPHGLVLAPPSAIGSPWLRKLGEVSTGFASGWMQVRGARRRRALDRGFVISDHADWDGLWQAIRATEAETIWLTHGFSHPMARWLREKGLNAEAVGTRFEGETDEEGLG
jgi:putative mRNA 3-end processing factor